MNAVPSSLSSALRVLIVDDDEVDRLSVRRLLRHQPMAFVEATSGAEALAAVEGGDEISCVLVDYYLPDVEARALIPQLLERRPHLAIVALTGLGDEGIAVALMKAGARDYLNKDSLDGGRLAASIRSAAASAAADARAAEFAALTLRHTERLEQLMEAAQHLVGKLDLRELATRGAAAARQVLGATSVLVRLHDGNDDVSVHEGEDILDARPTSSSSRMMRAPGEASRPHRADEGQTVLFTMWLSPPEQERRSVLSVRVHKGEASELALSEALFHQLGVLLTRSLESSRLMRSVHRAVQARDEVMAVVSHDLRGPLGSALLATSLLDGDVSEVGRPVLGRMEKSLKHMQRLVDDLVMVMKVERGDIPLQLEALSCRPLLHEAKAIVEDLARDAGVSVVVEGDGVDDDVVVRADRHRLMQVLSNVLHNGVKFTPPGGSVTLSAQIVGDDVELSVKDTGQGITAEKQTQIFDRYYTDDQRERGLGLGLAIAHGIVLVHGGTIGVDSEVGQGARFWVRLSRVAPCAKTTPSIREHTSREGE